MVATTDAVVVVVGSFGNQNRKPVAEAVKADICGAVGCHQTNELVPVTVAGKGTRVLCPAHADRFLFGQGVQ